MVKKKKIHLQCGRPRFNSWVGKTPWRRTWQPTPVSLPGESSETDEPVCCRKGDPFQGLKVGSCLTLRNELSKETHLLTKQEILLGRGAQAESSRVKETRRSTLPCGLQSQVLWWMDKFPGCFWSFILSPPWWRTHCSATMDASEKYSGRWLDTWCHLLTFPQLFQLVVAY